MLPLLLVGLLGTVASARECKNLCNINYERNLLEQQSQTVLAPICERGCDLFTVALISSSNKIDTRDPVVEKTSKAKSTASKTTVQPTSQPVQEVPERANSPSTTTHDPQNKKFKISQQFNCPVYEVHGNSPSGPGHPDIAMEACHSCNHACGVAYGSHDERAACGLGCYLQNDISKKSPDRHQSNHRSPFSVAHHAIINLAGHIGKFVKISWSFTQSVISPPVEKTKQFSNENMDSWKLQQPALENSAHRRTPSYSTDSMHFWNYMKRNFDINAQKLANDDPSVLVIYENQKPVKEEIKSHKDDHKRITKFFGFKRSKQHTSSQLDILECISRKSGLPRWFIALTLFSSVPIAVWLCLSLVGSADEAKVVRSKVADDKSLSDEEDDYCINEKARLCKEEKLNVQIV